jgi:hypothetical protein
MKNQLPMLMSIHNNDRVLYNTICGYYTNEQTKLGRSLKQIKKDLDQLTCMGTCIITSIISVDNTKEGRKFWIDIEKKYQSIYTNN